MMTMMTISKASVSKDLVFNAPKVLHDDDDDDGGGGGDEDGYDLSCESFHRVSAQCRGDFVRRELNRFS